MSPSARGAWVGEAQRAAGGGPLRRGGRAEAEMPGAKYSGTITFPEEDRLGVSNEPLEKKIAAVTVRGGEVIIIIEDKD